MTASRIAAADLVAAAARLFGTVVLDLADRTVGPALYEPRLELFRTLEGDELGADDGTLVVLVEPGEVRELVERHGTAGRAAQALTRELRAAGVL